MCQAPRHLRWNTYRALYICSALGSAGLSTAVLAQSINGPDGQPLPGQQGGLSLPPDQNQETPLQGLFEAEARADMADHPKDTSRTFTKDTPQGQVTIAWQRTGEKTWTYSVALKPKSPQLPPLSYSATVTTDANGISHTKTTFKPPVGKRVGPSYIFVAEKVACDKSVIVQYLKEVDTLTDNQGKVIQTSTLGWGIDGGVPYPAQSNLGGNQTGEDSPGVSDSRPGDTDQQMANGQLGRLKDQLHVKNGGAKGKREFNFWTYVICLAPLGVIGHWEWSFTINIDPGNPPYININPDNEPAWKPQ
jgi:hypothetical protein